MDNLNIYLKTQKPIKFYDICMIHQPSYDEILICKDNSKNKESEIDDFEKFLLPYYITLDNISEELTDEQKIGLTNFDLLSNSKEMLHYLLVSLEFFCKSEINDFDEDGISFEGFEGKLNKNNFDEFAEIILNVCGRERVKVEKKVFANDRQRDIWEKLQEGRRRNAKKNELKMEDILNICEFGGKYYIPIEEIIKWSIWRIINCYKTITGISSYENSFDIFLVSGENKLIEGKHWTELIKIDYKLKEEY